jgi:uncharacterized protein YukJ
MILKKGEIAVVNLKVRCSKNKIHYIKDVIFSHPYEQLKTKLIYEDILDRKSVKKINKKEDLFIIDIDVIQKVGMKFKKYY